MDEPVNTQYTYTELFSCVEITSHRGPQIRGLCPFHDDQHPSFSANLETGGWTCFAGCGQGYAPQFAEQLGLDPTDFSNGRFDKPEPQVDPIYQEETTDLYPQLSPERINQMDDFHKNLYNNYEVLTKDLPWAEDVISVLQVGYDEGMEVFTYPHFDPEGIPVNIKSGKIKQTEGHGSIRLYPLPLIRVYHPEEPLIICEGEKDCISLLSAGFNAITGTGGAQTIPRDLSQIASFRSVIIAYDNDSAGASGAKTLAQELYERFPHMSIRLHSWDADQSEGFDITDYFRHGKTAEDLERRLFSAPIFILDCQASITEFPCTDTGNAELFAAEFGWKFRYNHTNETWYEWTGQYWEADRLGKVQNAVIETARIRQRAAQNLTDADLRDKHWSAGKKLENNHGLRSCIAITQNLDSIATVGDEWNTDKSLLQCKNGVYDLDTGCFRPGIPSELLSQSTHLTYDPKATCPRWHQFLKEVTQGNMELIDYLQKAVGYSLTGTISEEVLFFLWGPGADGKSTFTEILLALTGDYGQKAPQSMLMAQNYGSGIPNDIARLKGARVIVSSEVDKGNRLAESLVKELTGGDTITARFLRQEFFDFKPTHTLWIHGNHKPTIYGADDGIWRRIRLIPFALNLSEKDRDPDLKAKLQQELSGILKWAIEGHKQYKQEGLPDPEIVSRATDSYRKEMDTIGRFLEEKVQQRQGAQVRAGALYEQYTRWCELNNEMAETKTMFGMEVTQRGLKKKRDGQGNYYTNLEIAAEH